MPALQRTGPSVRYPAVELLTGVLFFAVAWHDGLSAALPFDLAFTGALIALVFIDAEHMILPTRSLIPIVFAVIARIAVPSARGRASLRRLGSAIQWPALRHANLGSIAGWSAPRRIGGRRISVVNGLAMGKTSRR